jgi:hypothetical protein
MSPLSDRAFAESRHQYTHPRLLDPKGRPLRVTSVSAVVGAFDSGDKLGAGAGAAAKLIHSGQDYRKVWDDKRDVGSRIHGFAKLWIEGRSAEVPEEDMGHMTAFANWCNVVRPEWMHTERAGVGSVPCLGGPCAVCNDTGVLAFGGRLDAIGFWEDLFWLPDFKTGKFYRPELTIQLAGYANFEGFIIYDDDGMAVDLEPMPHIDRWCGLYISPNGVEAHVCPDPNKVSADWTAEQMKAEAFETFKALLYVKEWAKQMNRKGR